MDPLEEAERERMLRLDKSLPVPGFGEPYGRPIDNKDSILQEINFVLGKGKEDNPCIEYIITQPFGLITLPFGLGSINYNWFGHSALRFLPVFILL
jgi:hypothetical protein